MPTAQLGSHAPWWRSNLRTKLHQLNLLKDALELHCARGGARICALCFTPRGTRRRAADREQNGSMITRWSRYSMLWMSSDQAAPTSSSGLCCAAYRQARLPRVSSHREHIGWGDERFPVRP